jgi:pimeloyl-ACP methyl ester carboxylesterase
VVLAILVVRSDTHTKKHLHMQVAGDQDPYAPLHMQEQLFLNLGRGSDRTWSILSDADHAVHLIDGRVRFANIVTSFIKNGKRSEDYQRYW